MPYRHVEEFGNAMQIKLGEATLEARAAALLQRVRDYNERAALVTEFEIRSVLKEITHIGKNALEACPPVDVLTRISQTLNRAVAEANKFIARSGVRASKSLR